MAMSTNKQFSGFTSKACPICHEPLKSNQGYANCHKVKALVCISHCTECKHLDRTMSLFHCRYGITIGNKT